MKYVNNMTLKPGTVVEVADSLKGRITKIDRIEHDKLRVSLDEHDPSVGFDVHTRGFSRTPEFIAEVTELQLTEFDLITIEGIGLRQVHGIKEIRPGRHQFLLDEKYKPSITVDTVDPSLARPTEREESR